MDLAFEGERFVVYGELSPRESVNIAVSKTYAPVGHVIYNYDFLDSVSVELFENGLKIENLRRLGKYQDFISPSGFRVKEGNSYHFIFSHPTIPTATSEAEVIPEKFALIKAEISKEAVISTLNPRIPSRKLTIAFKGNQRYPYFVIRSRGYYNNRHVGSAIVSSSEPSEFENPCIPGGSGHHVIYSSACYNKETNEITAVLQLEGSFQDVEPGQPGGNASIDRLNLNLTYISPIYVSFYKDLMPEEGILRAFTTPTRPPGNIKNGYGAIVSKNDVESNAIVPY